MGRLKTNTPESLKKYKAEYYQKNRARIISFQKEWNKKNPEKIKAIRKKWRSVHAAEEKKRLVQRKLENPEIFKEYQRRYFRNNLEKARLASTRWRIENREYMRKYLEKNPEKFRMASLRRRASKISNSTESQIESANSKIIEMLSVGVTQCPYCKNPFKTSAMEVDHIYPLSKGGSHSAENVTMACEKCNGSKGSKILWIEWTPPHAKK